MTCTPTVTYRWWEPARIRLSTVAAHHPTVTYRYHRYHPFPTVPHRYHPFPTVPYRSLPFPTATDSYRPLPTVTARYLRDVGERLVRP